MHHWLCFYTIGEEYEYVLMYMENTVIEITDQQGVELYIASRTTSDVSVTMDNPGGTIPSSSQTFTLPAQTVKMFSLPQEARQSTSLANKAIRVVADGNIIVYALNRNLYSTDGLTVFNVDQLGEEYYALAYDADINTQIGLIAVEDGVTTIDVRVPAATVVQWSGVQYNAGQVLTVSLSKYQTAVIKSTVGDLTGRTNILEPVIIILIYFKFCLY